MKNLSKVKMMFAAISIIGFLVSCEETYVEDDYLRLNDTLYIFLGQKLVSVDNTMSIKYDSLVAENRCPADVVCVWAGYARVRLNMLIKGTNHTFDLSTIKLANPPIDSDTIISDYRIKLVGVLPYPDTRFHIHDFQRYIKVVIEPK